MLRSFTAFLLICTVLSANFSRFFVYAGFEFNKSYIATVLCENRDKPVLKCMGKCYLKKQLKQETEKEKKQQQESKKTSLQEAFFAKETKFYFPPVMVEKALALEVPFVLPQHADVIFHPPQV